MMDEEFSFSPGEIALDTGFYGTKFDFNYGARVLVPKGERMHVRITDNDTSCILFEADGDDIIVSSTKKYYINYRIDIWHGEDHFEHTLDLNERKVLIVCPTRAIGDTIAWIPYVEEFQKVHKCKLDLYVGKHVRELLKTSYPNLNFINDKDLTGVYYATYYLGVFFPTTDRDSQPMDFRLLGLQKSIAMILGLQPVELQTKLKVTGERIIKEPYVCISVQSTTLCKTWNNTAGWLEVIDFLKAHGYRVLCIDKDKVFRVGRFTNSIPFGCEDFTGPIPLQERVNMLAYADFFVGGSSGLAWLAWATGIPVVLICGFTLPFNEFYTPYRVINFNTCTGCWHEVEFQNDDYGWCPRHKGTDRELECSRLISGEYVINTIKKLMKDYNLTDIN